MSRTSFLSVTVTALWAASAAVGGAELPKQGSFAVTHTVTASAPAAIDLGDGTWAAIIDARVISTNDAGSGFFTGCSGHCVGLDVGTQFTVVCMWADRDGDKFVTRAAREPGSPKLVSTISNGTGKYKGIEGRFEGREEPLLADTAPGQRNIITRHKGEYKIP